MKRFVFLYFLMIACSITRGQDAALYAAIDTRSYFIPDAETRSADRFAAYIVAHFRTPADRLRAIYAWVTTNIRYSKDSMYSINWSGEYDQKVAATLRRRTGVCENYAAVFSDIANRSGIPAYVVTGFAKIGGSVMRNGHCWSAVQLNGEWLLCDPTWDEGTRGNTRHFLVPPNTFIDTHLPFDPLWQLLPQPVATRDFNHGTSSSRKMNYNFTDSVKSFIGMNELQQLEATSRRMVAAGVTNELQKNWLAYMRMKIAIYYEHDDMNLYNGAVEDLNKATGIFNNFIAYRNRQFTPAATDDRLHAMLDPISVLIAAAKEKVAKIGKVVPNFQYDTGELNHRLAAMTLKVQEQRQFVQRYLATQLPERTKLFYK